MRIGKHGADIERMRLREIGSLHCGQRECGPHIIATFGRITTEDPETHQRDRKLDAEYRIDAPAERKRNCRSQIVVCVLYAAHPFCLFGTFDATPRRLREIQEIVAMRDAGRDLFVTQDELLARIVANGLEHPVARALLRILGAQQRLLHER
ncbi:MAG TPA: hypothetical protein VKV24_13320, partial [Casimicrobiaceae bacterium]|nr:hypothetical protein [Casimicrobiaceae bacterium]